GDASGLLKASGETWAPTVPESDTLDGSQASCRIAGLASRVSQSLHPRVARVEASLTWAGEATSLRACTSRATALPASITPRSSEPGATGPRASKLLTSTPAIPARRREISALGKVGSPPPAASLAPAAQFWMYVPLVTSAVAISPLM